MDRIEKAGEGSRGGKVIGHTSTGKAIYASKDEHIVSGSHPSYSAKDHKEAAAKHTDQKMKDFHTNWQKIKGNPLNKSEGIMDINTQIEAMAEKMEKSVKTDREVLIDLVKDLGAEGIKKAMPTLSETQQELLKSVISEELEKSMKMDDKIIAASKVEGKLTDTKIQEEVANDDADEKIAAAAEPEVNHQGGEKQEGWEGQVIKSQEEKMNIEEVIKSFTDEQKAEFSSKLIAKGMDPKKVSEMMDKKIDASEKKDEKEDKKMIKEEMKEVKKSELLAEASQNADTDQMTEGKVRAKKEAVADLEIKAPTTADAAVNAPMTKSFSWEDPSRLLKACTGGRNHHFSVNDFYDDVLSKAQTSQEETFEKSDKETINDILAKGEDCSALDVKAKKMMAEEKKKMNGKIQKSFTEDDMAAALGLTKEECAKLLGE